MKSKWRRIEELQRALVPDEQAGQVVIYDPQSGKSLVEPNLNARAVLFIPDNGREQVAENGRP